ncbi:MAG: hypothetical protein FD123_626 [Bacteroidetes bacterium]|nr:MAG: hypothetical protein FD123_626 [Bacteroidota bacterium]
MKKTFFFLLAVFVFCTCRCPAQGNGYFTPFQAIVNRSDVVFCGIDPVYEISNQELILEATGVLLDSGKNCVLVLMLPLTKTAQLDSLLQGKDAKALKNYCRKYPELLAGYSLYEQLLRRNMKFRNKVHISGIEIEKDPAAILEAIKNILPAQNPAAMPACLQPAASFTRTDAVTPAAVLTELKHRSEKDSLLLRDYLGKKYPVFKTLLETDGGISPGADYTNQDILRKKTGYNSRQLETVYRYTVANHATLVAFVDFSMISKNQENALPNTDAVVQQFASAHRNSSTITILMCIDGLPFYTRQKNMINYRPHYWAYRAAYILLRFEDPAREEQVDYLILSEELQKKK